MLVAKILLILFTSATAALGNSMLKAGATAFAGEDQLLEIHHLPRVFMKPTILAGIGAYGISQLLWITVLRVVDLSLAYPLQIGLNFALIMFAAWFYFKEPVTLGKLVGVAMIFLGIVIVAIS